MSDVKYYWIEDTTANITAGKRASMGGFDTTKDHLIYYKLDGTTLRHILAADSSNNLINVMGNIPIATGKYIGFSGAGRIEFTDDTVDYLTILNATLGIGAAPASGATLDVRGGLSLFGVDAIGNAYIYENSLNFCYSTNANGTGYINLNGYLNANTQFCDLKICDGKTVPIIMVDGSTHAVGINTIVPGCALCVNGGVSIGDDAATADNNLHVVGAIDCGSTLMVGGNILLGANYLSNDGGNEGISIGATGNVTCSGFLYAANAVITTGCQAGKFFSSYGAASSVYGHGTSGTSDENTDIVLEKHSVYDVWASLTVVDNNAVQYWFDCYYKILTGEAEMSLTTIQFTDESSNHITISCTHVSAMTLRFAVHLAMGGDHVEQTAQAGYVLKRMSQ